MNENAKTRPCKNVFAASISPIAEKTFVNPIVEIDCNQVSRKSELNVSVKHVFAILRN